MSSGNLRRSSEGSKTSLIQIIETDHISLTGFEYKSSVFHDLKHIDKRAAKKIFRELEDALFDDPLCGEALSLDSLRGCSNSAWAIIVSSIRKPRKERSF
ncbi:MAG: hypothetical protein MUO26_05100 [Methanotrichaceae archaeon]|nr:hypothetical protein [Methanotrichaceae archaeon]